MDLVFLFLVTGLAVLATWVAYPLFVYLLAWIRRCYPDKTTQTSAKKETAELRVSVIIAAYNEEGKIGERIENIVSQEGDFDVEVIVGSDGSKDGTVVSARALGLSNVRVYDFPFNRGRAMVHNDCSSAASGDILVFTDSETRFSGDFLKRILACFHDQRVGCVSGRIVYVNENSTDIGTAAGLYWKYEEMVRTSESDLGILAFGTGAAIAMRKGLYDDMGGTEDVDYAQTLNAVAKGYRVKYVPAAEAYDYISETPRGAFKTNVRKTSRCFRSVIKRIFQPRFIVKYPSVFLAALFHKTFRHLTPYFMLLFFVSNLMLLKQQVIFFIVFVVQCLFYACSAIGFYLSKTRDIRSSCFFSLPYSFLLLNMGRFVGVGKAILGMEEASYRTIK